MPIPDRQWITVSPTEFPWEQEAFDYIKANAPSGVVGAWSNFEFVAPNGSIYEVDLMVLTTTDLFLVEIKSWGGTLDGSMNNLVRYGRNPQDARSITNPLLLLNRKSKILSSMLKEQPTLRNQRVPFVGSLLFLNNADLTIKIPAAERPHIHHQSEIIGALTPKAGAPRMDLAQVKALNKAFQNLGIRRLNRTAKVGDWILDDLLEDTERYQDHLAHHASVAESFRRVRTYTVPTKGGAALQDMARRAARREFRLTDALHHPGILKPLEYKEHEYGPALVYFYDKDSERLDNFLASRSALLPTAARLDLVRQLADILRYAHARRIYHRGLAPQNILVLRPDSERPQLQVMNWQTGMEQEGTAGTSHITALMEDASKAYMAPEACSKPSAAPGDLMDIFALGAVTFFILAGEPPAESHLALYQKLQEHPGLRLSTVVEGFGSGLEGLVETCTHPHGAKRPSSMEEVLRLLDSVTQELLDTEQQEVFSPLDALPGQELPGGYRVVRDLGKGAVSRALEVARDGRHFVLKVAHDFDSNQRMEEEAQALQKLEHPHIVTLEAKLDMGGRTCLLLQLAGETLAQRLADWGPLQLDQLERFGGDLLNALVFLEKVGVHHRDIKPANLGITRREKGALRLFLFDFSLTQAPVESIGAGTPDYIDPFLRALRPPRWDQSAERYSAGVTLYEMATGTLPRWGDGKSDPGLDPDVMLELEPERFDPLLRESLTEFFHKALHRDRAQRFDNAEEMMAAWVQALKEGGETEEDDELDQDQLAERVLAAGKASTLASLGLPARVLRALDRLGVFTVEHLLSLPGGSLHTAGGVGARTRRQLVILQELLHHRFPDRGLPSTQDVEEEEADRSVLEAFLALVLGEAPGEHELRAAFVGHASTGSGLRWPTLSELAKQSGQDPMKVAKQIPGWRRAWAKLSHLRYIRNEIDELLTENCGILSAEEVALGLLAQHGALSNDPDHRLRLAASVARAAVEAESTEPEARYLWQRVGTGIMIARTDASLRYLEQLGQMADRLAVREPLASPKRALEEARSVAPPEDFEELSPHRLMRLAAQSSLKAAVSSREEFYPRDMEAQRALILAHSALVGDIKLTPDEVRARVSSRYPEARALPGRPALDLLLQAADGDLHWSETQECYVRRTSLVTTSGSTVLKRYSTASGTRASGSEPQVAEARRFEERLRHAYEEDAFLVLMVDPGFAQEAERELLRRFAFVHRPLDRLLLQAMKDTATEKNANWDKVLTIDARPEGNAWRNLNRLVSDSVAGLTQSLLGASEPQLLTNPGLLKRYGQMAVLERLRDAAGARGGVPAVWLLLPTEETGELPTLDGQAIALIDSGQRARIPVSWLENRHRAAKLVTPS